MISWRNPEPDQGGFDLDTYAAAVLEARDAVSAITGSGPVGVQGVCSGGIVAACALNHLAAEGRLQECVAHLALLVCLLDARQAGTTSALVSREVAAAAAAQSARTGYIDGESFARVFAWLRPNDLVWNYVVNNYFLGKDPPAFDVLHWNQDTVRMPAGLHRDFLRIAIENPFAEPGALDGARLPGRPAHAGRADLRGGRQDRPHRPRGHGLAQRPAARRRRALRALLQRSRAGAREPGDARLPVELSGHERPRRRPRDLAGRRAAAPGFVVDRLHRLARRAQRCAARGSGRARRRSSTRRPRGRPARSCTPLKHKIAPRFPGARFRLRVLRATEPERPRAGARRRRSWRRR